MFMPLISHDKKIGVFMCIKKSSEHAIVEDRVLEGNLKETVKS